MLEVQPPLMLNDRRQQLLDHVDGRQRALLHIDLLHERLLGLDHPPPSEAEARPMFVAERLHHDAVTLLLLLRYQRQSSQHGTRDVIRRPAAAVPEYNVTKTQRGKEVSV